MELYLTCHGAKLEQITNDLLTYLFCLLYVTGYKCQETSYCSAWNQISKIKLNKDRILYGPATTCH